MTEFRTDLSWDDFDAVLLDMDGTLYHEGEPLPGAADAVNYLQERGVPVACITNASAQVPGKLAAKLAAMGIRIAPDFIYNSAVAMRDWVVSNWDRATVFNFAGEAFDELLADVAEFVADDAPSCDVVAIGSHTRENDTPLDMERALIALRLLRSGASMVVGSADRVFPVRGGGVDFGSGAWGAWFSYAADLPNDRVYHAGKPNPEFFVHAADRVGVCPQRCLVIGDNLESDIAGANEVGMTTALVFSGITDAARLEHSSVKPDFAFQDMADWLAAMTRTSLMAAS